MTTDEAKVCVEKTSLFVNLPLTRLQGKSESNNVVSSLNMASLLPRGNYQSTKVVMRNGRLVMTFLRLLRIAVKPLLILAPLRTTKARRSLLMSLARLLIMLGSVI